MEIPKALYVGVLVADREMVLPYMYSYDGGA